MRSRELPLTGAWLALWLAAGCLAACSERRAAPAVASDGTGAISTPATAATTVATAPPVRLEPRAPAEPQAPRGPQDPADGPWNRDLVVFRSQDGLAFSRPVTFIERAGVPCVIADARGRLVAVFQWFPFDRREAFDRVAVAFSTDRGESWSAPQPMVVNGLPGGLMRPFDPTVVQLADGRYRLYFTSNTEGPTGVPAIYSAVSDDAVTYQFEPGARFAPAEGTVDAAVVLFEGAWHLFSHNQRANTGAGYHATSADGLVFTRRADVSVGAGRQWIGNAVAVGGRLRYYGSGRDGVWSAVSEDGDTWSVEPGVRAAGGDATAVALDSGAVLLIAVGEARADASRPPWMP